jgi:hypothetical protein
LATDSGFPVPYAEPCRPAASSPDGNDGHPCPGRKKM